MKKIILASTSPRRKELFEKTGLHFEVASSDYVEDMTLNLPPDKLAVELSLGKAKAVANKFPNSIIVAADTFIAYDNKVLGKPHTPEKAKEMLNMLSGEIHSVITGFTIIDSDSNKTFSKAVEAKVYFKNLTEKEIDEYIKTGEPIDRAGAYAIQSGGAKFVEKIEGDYDGIVGLPVGKVVKALKDFGVNV